MTSLLVHVSFLCPSQLHRAHVVIVSWHLFVGYPNLRRVLQLIGLSKYSNTFVFACSPGISMNLGDSFSLKVSRSGVEEMFLVDIQVAFFTSRSCIISIVHCHILQYPGWFHYRTYICVRCPNVKSVKMYLGSVYCNLAFFFLLLNLVQ